MTGKERFWIYVGTQGIAKMHRSGCGHCKDGKGGGQEAEHIGDAWYGFYAAVGAAIDAGESTGFKVEHDQCMKGHSSFAI